MPPARRNQAGPQQSIRWMMPPIVAVAAGASLWFGLPVGIVLLLAMLVFGWVEPQPMLSGPKASVGGPPTASGPSEARKLRQWQAARMMRSAGFGWSPEQARLKRFQGAQAGPARLTTGSEKAKDFGSTTLNRLGLRPLQSSTVIAPLAALAVLLAPLHPAVDLLPVRVASAACALVAIVGFSSSQRTALRLPGVTWAAFAGRPGRIVAGVFAGLVFAGLSAFLAVQLSDWPPFWAASGLCGFATGASVSARGASRVQWSQDEAARDEWMERWSLLTKPGQAPECTGTTTVGPFRITTFAPSAGLPTQAVLDLAPRLPTVLGGVSATLSPNPEQPQLVDAIEWVEAEWPDACDPEVDPAVLAVAVRAALEVGYGQYGAHFAVGEVERWSPDDSEALWRIEVSGADLEGIRTTDGKWDPNLLTGHMFPLTLLEHNPFFGGPYLLVGSPDADLPEEARDAVDRIRLEDEWTRAWMQSLGTKMNAPTLMHQNRSSATLPGKQVLYCDTFALKQGQPLSRVLVREAEEKLRSSGPSDPKEPTRRPAWLTNTGWHTDGRPGTRHDIAFRTLYSHADGLPKNPGQVPASDDGRSKQVAQEWLLSGMFNTAFDQARLPRPEVYRATPIAMPEPLSGRGRGPRVLRAGPTGTIWKVSVRLYSCSFAEVSSLRPRLAGFLGASWMRVVDNPDEPGCVDFYVGAAPLPGLRWVRRGDEEFIRSLDWAQAWADSGVRVSSTGATPKLVGSAPLPDNDAVLVLDFKLPSGISRLDVVKAKATLKTATGNGFIDVRDGSDASSLRLMVAEADPMPTRVMLSDYLGRPGPVPFAVDVTGAEVFYDTSEMPHAAVLGSTGSGKSLSAKALLLGRLLAGSELFVADPMKGAADFKEFRAAARAFVVPRVDDEADEKALLLEALVETEALFAFVYTEMRRRVGVNSRHGCDYRSVPPEHRYPQWTVFVDEFESLITSAEAVGKPSDDPEIEREREQAILWNATLAKLLSYIGRVAREGRSAGISMVLSGQKLAADDLEKVGLKTLKNNLGRILMGITTWGDRSSGLIEPAKAADIDNYPPGRGLYEPRIGERAGRGAFAVQVAYADDSSISEVLSGLPAIEPADLGTHRRKVDLGSSPAYEEVDMDEVVPVGDAEPAEVLVLDEFAFDLGDLEVEAPQEEDDLDWGDLAAPAPVAAVDDLDWGDLAEAEPPALDDLEWDAPDPGPAADDPWDAPPPNTR